jgi:hypothetical protein
MVEMTAETKETIEPGSVAILTTTAYAKWYPGEVDKDGELGTVSDKIRGDLAIRLLKEAKQQGFQLSVVDGSNNEAFRGALTAAGINWQAEEEHSMSGSRRQALRGAAGLPGAKYLVWTEPEKVSMIEDDLVMKAVEMIGRGEADIVIPKRSEASKKTYPKFQIDSEMKANDGINRLLVSRALLKPEEADLDWMIGPRIFRNDEKLAGLFTEKYEFASNNPNPKDKLVALQGMIKTEFWSNFTFFPVAAALAQGYRVRSLEVDYRHPAEQTALERDTKEFNDKRVAQRVGILTGMVYLLDQLTENKHRVVSGKMVKAGGN